MSNDSYRPNFGDLVMVLLLDEETHYHALVTEVRGNVATVFIGNGLVAEYPADHLIPVPISAGVAGANVNFAEMMRSSHRAIGIPRGAK